MLIIAGHYNVPAERRKAFVEAHADLIRCARAHPGCLDVSICEDSVDPARVNLMELWESEAALAAFRKIAKPPKTGVKIEMGTIQKHHISHSGPPF